MRKSHILALALAAPLCLACGQDAIEFTGEADGGGGDDDIIKDPADAAPPVVDNRVQEDLQLLYRFDGLAGQTVIQDVSGVGSPFDLTVLNPESVTWEGGGLSFVEPTVAQNLTPATKVIEACQASGELTIEAWVKNTTLDSQGRVVSSSESNNQRNFALKQDGPDWEFRLRTSNNNNNGTNPSADANEAVSIETQHIVYTRDSVSVANFYVDRVKQVPTSITGNLGNWDLDYGMYVGNEPTLDRPWLGTIYLLAVYCRELDQAEINQNYGERY